MNVTEEHTYSSTEVCALVGITYRQLDYWQRRGIITVAHPPHGSGSRRVWTHGEVTRLKALTAAYEEACAVLNAFTTGELWQSTAGD